MKEFFKKFTSRKFVTCLLAVIGGFVVMFVGQEGYVNTIIGGLGVVIPAVAYCIVEGRIDEKSVKTISDTALDVAKDLHVSKEVKETVERIGDLAEVIVEMTNSPKTIDKNDGE